MLRGFNWCVVGHRAGRVCGPSILDAAALVRSQWWPKTSTPTAMMILLLQVYWHHEGRRGGIFNTGGGVFAHL